MFLALFICVVVTTSAELKALIELSRHGARAPIAQFPWSTSDWPQGLGELTPSGMRQHFLIGAELRERYIIQEPLLSSSFLQEEIYVRSTDTNRTIMSAESQLLGLYPEGPLLEAELVDTAVPPIPVQHLAELQAELGLDALPNRRQPVPVHVVPAKDDLLLSGFWPSVCPRIGDIADELQRSPEFLQRVAEFEKEGGLQSKIQPCLGTDVSFYEAVAMADVLRSELWEEYPLPSCLPESVYLELLDVLEYYLSFLFHGEAGRLASTRLFESVLYYFDGIRNNRSTKKFVFYSAHDLTVNACREALNIYDGISPPYASTLFFELHSDDTVRIVYNGEGLKLPDCSAEFCPYKEFAALLEDLIVPDLEAACKRSRKNVPYFKIVS